MLAESKGMILTSFVQGSAPHLDARVKDPEGGGVVTVEVVVMVPVPLMVALLTVEAVPSLLAVLEEETEIMPLPKPTAVPEAEGVLGVGTPAVQRTDMGAKSMHSDNWRC
jgi:hypothetical protein